MGLLDSLQNLINEHGSSTILRERLLLIKEESDKLTNDCRRLEVELAKCKEENIQLRKQLEAQAVTQQFVEYRGAFFKRRSSGAYDPTVYCPMCQAPLGSFEDFFPYECERCNIELDFNGKQLPQILKELSKIE